MAFRSLCKYSGKKCVSVMEKKVMNGVTVLLVATSPQRGFRNAIDSLKLHGFNAHSINPTINQRKETILPKTKQSIQTQESKMARHVVLGLGDRWGGWRHRMQMYRDAACEVARIDPDSLVVCMDAYDTVSMRSFDAGLVRTFEEFGKPVLLSLERVCGGNCVSIRDWWKTDGQKYTANGVIPKNRYVNGGLLMGRASAIRDVYQWMLNSGAKDDQIGLARWALAHRDQWAPDVSGSIFRNQVFADHLTEIDLQGRGCYFAHFPGSNDWCIEPYDRAVKTILKRPSNVKSKNRGTPATFAAYIISLIIVAIALLLVVWTLLPKRFKTISTILFQPSPTLQPSNVTPM